MMDRRQFLVSAAALSLPAALGAGHRAAHAASRWPLGLQMFTVMAQFEADPESLLRDIAAIGYREVETIGTFGRDPGVLRGLLDRHGLRSPSMHLMPNALYQNFLRFTRREITADAVGGAWATDMALSRLDSNVKEAIDWAKILGQQYIVLQMIWPDQMRSLALMRDFCSALDSAGRLCAKAGLTFCFHNHADEFAPQEGYVPYQVILDSTDPGLVKLELDLYWATRAKADPLRLLGQHPGRYRLCHVKDSTPEGDFATVGKGVIDFRRLIPAARRSGVRHFFVEYDRADDPMAVVRDAYGYLKTLD